jgi:hypothetical protein
MTDINPSTNKINYVVGPYPTQHHVFSDNLTPNQLRYLNEHRLPNDNNQLQNVSNKKRQFKKKG